MSEFKSVLDKKAVAIKYDEAQNKAPVIVASGMGYLAEKIVETATENGIPVYEDNSLATMLTRLKLGAEIPEELYQTIVEIYLYFLNYLPAQPVGEEAAETNNEESEGQET